MTAPFQPGGRATPFQVSEEKYSASVASEPLGTRVLFRGTISTVNPATVLNPFLDAVHEEVVKKGERAVRVDLRELEFCNSSGFKAFIHWIQRIQALPEAQRYGLRFLSNPARKWQKTSLLALSCYAVNTVAID
ncbi:conserved hypothetical protein [Anaeromyxobacter sp. K]|uniref:hypothetical protein n=1 Tax=Anaeromyxobacter sp. (strain K) TaxID=447217 RepID=UPI00015F8C62|nr:hypothetical protein [Anaeromyxobacter sp. K]ACG72201.1 conserved hypothetical protein [Anaeromyxobacter sp. K]